MEVRQVGCKSLYTILCHLCVLSLTQNILPVLDQALIWCNLPMGIVLAMKLAPMSSCCKKEMFSKSQFSGAFRMTEARFLGTETRKNVKQDL